MDVIERDLQLAVAAETSEPPARTLTLEDFWRLKTVTEAQPSPDGSVVAYVVGTYDEAKNSSYAAIWLADLETGQTRRFTSGEKADMQPRWSPDGSRLAFVSARSGAPQIYVIDRDGGEPRRLTNLERGANSPVWSPDGSTILFVSTVKSDRQTVPQEHEWLKSHPGVELGPSQLRLTNSLASRVDGRGYVDSRMHLFSIPVDGEGTEPRQLTDGDFDNFEAAWSPDGKTIAFLSSRADDREHRMASDVFAMHPEGGEVRRLTDGDLMAGSPSWSPDGRTIAFYASPAWSEVGYVDTHLWVVSADGGDQRDLSGSLDLGHRHVQPDYAFPGGNPPAWSADSCSVYFTLIDHGDDALHVAGRESGDVRRLSAPGTDIQGFQVAGERFVLLACRPDHPFDVFVMPLEGGAPSPLTATNASLLEGKTIVTPEVITCKGPKDWDIEGWLYLPDGVEKPPLILHVHGGPYGAWGTGFYFQAQALAGMGYASLYVNPRGSLGYGQEFSRAADFGEDDFRDLLAAIDTVVEAGKVDGGRIAITGISYGGFMTNWGLGHSDRFRAGVSVNGVSNQISMYGTSDMTVPWLPREFGGEPWEPEGLERFLHHSPIRHVDRIEAPLLLIQSENDYRCPIEQGEQMLNSLRGRKKIVALVRFPGCSHVIAGTGTPLQRLMQWKLAFDWFDAYVKPEREHQDADVDEGGAIIPEPEVQ